MENKKASLSLGAHNASMHAYYLIDLGSQEAVKLLMGYYKFDRQDALDGWNKALEDNKSFWANHYAKAV